MRNFFKSPSDIRDGLFIFAIFSYFIGYLSISIFSWKKGLGFVPTLDLQYFVAGFIPAIVILLSVYYFYFLPFKLIEQDKNRSFNFYFFIFFILSILGLFIVSYLFFKSGKIGLFIFSTFMIVIILSYFYDIFFTLQLKLIRKIIIIFVLLFWVDFLYYYFYNIYPNMPQEFGGFRPRKAYLDLYYDKISKKNILLLNLKKQGNPKNRISRSRLVTIMYKTNNIVLISIPSDSNNSKNNIYELNRKDISSIIYP